MQARALWVVSVLLVFVCCGELLGEPPRAQTLFDGTTLNGWEGNTQFWRVADGAITGEIVDGQTLRTNEFLFWKGELHDFELTAEFRISGGPAANSGIQFRSQRLENGTAAGYQADLDAGATWLGRIYDEHGRELLVERGTRVSIAPDGRRWVDDFAKPDDFRALLRAGQWNTYQITAAASHVEVRVNGVLCAVLDDHQIGAADLSGRLAFQLHSGPGPAKIEFRNIHVTDLGRTAPPAAASAAEAAVIRPSADDGKPLNLGFEIGSLGGWRVEGDAWQGQPSKSDTIAPRLRKPDQPTNHAGNYWIGGNEARAGDAGTGTLTSQSFEVTQRWASFLVGGGKDIAAARVEIVDESTGKTVAQATGAGIETMQRQIVDLEGSLGRRIFIRIVDNSKEPLGHINFDDFVLHDRQPRFSTVVTDSRQNESAVLWHLRPNPAPATAIANPAAQSVVAGMMLTEGFQAELIAAEPEVHQPIAFAIDERGRLWIAEAFSYPNKQPAGQGKDRITILEDTNGDGTFETRKVFAEGLNLVSALEVGLGGVWIGAAPELLFIPDRNRDDRPDGPPEVLLDGWGYQDTHETLNSFSWGPDGWLYGNQGVFTKSLIGKPGATEAERVALRAGIWRYHPLRREFEVFAHGGSNQWGLDFNEAGQLFMTHCRSFHGGGGTTHVIRNGHFWNQTNSNHAPFISNMGPAFAPELKNFLPASARYDSGEGGAGKRGTGAVYGGHSHVGTMIYLGDNWPDIYRDHLFTINLHGHQINHQHNVRQGSGYETLHAGFDLLLVPDPTFVGVDLQFGPDGAAYIIDWSDQQHCHNPHDDRWDRTNGRIYRVSWAKTFRPAQVNLVGKSDVELAELQTHKNDWFARTARRLLQERAAARKIDTQALARLRTLAGNSQDSAQALRGLWTLHVMGALESADLASALQQPGDLLRAWAVQLATERTQSPRLPVETLTRLAVDDPSATVRLALASALPLLPADARWQVGAALAAHGEDNGDRFLPKMIWYGLAPLVAQNPARALALADTIRLPSLADSILWYAGRSLQGREQIARRLAGSGDESALRSLRLLAFSLDAETGVTMPAGWSQVAARFAGNPQTRGPVDQLSALFGDKEVLTRTRELLGNENAALEDRRRAFDLLKRVGDREAAALYVRLLDQEAFRSAVIPLLGITDDPGAAAGLLRQFASLRETDRYAALATLTSRPSFALALLQAVEAKAVDKKTVSALHVRQMRNLRNDSVNEALDRVFGPAVETSAAARDTISRLKKVFDEAPLWAYEASGGAKIYQRTCANCHPLDGAGTPLGPDLAGSWRNGVDYFLENIVDPNAVVGEGFRLNLIERKSGTIVSGIIERETDTALVVRTATETVTVPRSDVEEIRITDQSIMPSGILESLTQIEAIELLKFLTTRR